MDKLEILREYNFYEDVPVFLYTKDRISEHIKEILPYNWIEALCEEEKEKKILKIIEIWKRALDKELSSTISYLEANLVDVDLVKIGESYYLFYSIVSQDSEILYYIGGLPMKDDKIIYEKSIPDYIKIFYEEIHNGFYDYCSKSMGVVEFENITCLADDEWGIMEEINDSIKVNLNTTFSFFENGMGGYVAVDFETDKSIIWFTDEPPVYDVKFWDAVDEWIVLGMQE